MKGIYSLSKITPVTVFQIFVLVSILLLTACEQNKLKRAEALYTQRRYAAAVEQLDIFIHNGKNGAFVTRAELIRSSSYYSLGLAAVDKENWPLSIRLFKLANSEQADIELAKVYKTLALAAQAAGDNAKALSYYTLILSEISYTDLTPEILQLRIALYLDAYDDKTSAWNDYIILYDKYPEDPFEIKARPYIQRFIASNVNAAVAKAIDKDYDTALAELFDIRKYPVSDADKVDQEISNIYQEMAENEIRKTDYFEANRLFLKAMQYYPDKKDIINKRLNDIAYLYIEKGNDYLKVRDFDTAMLYYQKTYEIIPDFELANNAITNLRNIKNNIRRAAEIGVEALKLENSKNYAEARKLYQQAYQLDTRTDYNQSAIIMGNMIEADKDPIAFSRKIVMEYKNGLLYRRIQAQKQLMLKKFTINEVRDSGWKIMLSPGQNKYEARYDIMTPSENLYYVWQVNLRDRSITPLNKLSERIMQ